MSAAPIPLAARLGALCYIAWGLFHVWVAWDIQQLGSGQDGIAQARTFQLATYMLTISLAAIAVAGNWRNRPFAYRFNLGLMAWADGIWLLVVVLPGYVPLLRGLVPPGIFVVGAVLTTLARRAQTSRLK